MKRILEQLKDMYQDLISVHRGGILRGKRKITIGTLLLGTVIYIVTCPLLLIYVLATTTIYEEN